MARITGVPRQLSKQLGFLLQAMLFLDDLKLAPVAAAIAGTPNQLTVRGHTDSLGYANGGGSNWSLSSARADTTRRALIAAGVAENRFRRIEGVADTDPFNPEDRTDPRNRRISITVLNESVE